MKTVNHECYVDLEVANLLKEAGFDWETEFGQHIWDRGKCLATNRNFNSEKYLVSLPTLDVAQRWLREVKEYHIILSHRTEMFFEEKRYNLNEIKADIINKYPGGGLYITSTVFYRTYEEAQEDGIKKALELILKKGE